MNIKQVEAIKGLFAAILTALLAAKVIDPGLSDAITGVLSGALAVYAAFRVIPPQKIEIVPDEEFYADNEWRDGTD